MFSSATPIHDGMRTPMRDRAWNPYATISPPRLVIMTFKPKVNVKYLLRTGLIHF